MPYVGFRLSNKMDADIIQALSNSKNISKEIKRLIRIAIKMHNGQQVATIDKTSSQLPRPSMVSSKAMQTLDDEVDSAEIAANLLAGF